MNIKTYSFIPVIIFACSIFSFPQKTAEGIAAKENSLRISASAVKATAAYAEVLLRKTELEAQLEEFSVDYTEEFPKVKEIKYELIVLQNELDKMLATSAADTGKLTLALGKLIVRKTELATDLFNLRRQYNDDHPEVKRAKRKVAVYEKAIRDILP